MAITKPHPVQIKHYLKETLINYENKKGQKGKQVSRGDALKAITRKLVHMAINGTASESLASIKEIGDRIDGKAIQSIAGVEGKPIAIIERVIVQRDNAPPPKIVKDITPKPVEIAEVIEQTIEQPVIDRVIAVPEPVVIVPRVPKEKNKPMVMNTRSKIKSNRLKV